MLVARKGLYVYGPANIYVTPNAVDGSSAESHIWFRVLHCKCAASILQFAFSGSILDRICHNVANNYISGLI